VTRKSKRELERALADLDEAGQPVAGPTSVQERYSGDVVDVIYATARAVLRIKYQHSDAIATAPTDQAVARFLEAVREEYDLDKSRDKRVSATLLSVTERSPHWHPIDAFASALCVLAGRQEPTDENGTTLSTLVEVGDDQAAKRLLVRAAYGWLAGGNGGGGPEREVPA
jgi:hypothetical protein